MSAVDKYSPFVVVKDKASNTLALEDTRSGKQYFVTNLDEAHWTHVQFVVQKRNKMNSRICLDMIGI